MLMQRLLEAPERAGDPEDVEFVRELKAAVDAHAELPDSPRSTAQMAAESFAGRTVEDYQAYVRAFMSQPVQGFETISMRDEFTTIYADTIVKAEAKKSEALKPAA